MRLECQLLHTRWRMTDCKWEPGSPRRESRRSAGLDQAGHSAPPTEWLQTLAGTPSPEADAQQPSAGVPNFFVCHSR